MPADYFMPTKLDEALSLLKTRNPDIVAGGTDYFPSRGQAPLGQSILDLSRLDGFSHMEWSDTHLKLGAGVTWSRIAQTNLPEAFKGLQAAAKEVGSIQIQNTGTIVGNICNASPAADGIPPLLTLATEVEIASTHGTRQQPLEDFLTGVRQTTLAADEIVVGLSIPKPPDHVSGAFEKLGARRYLVISIAMTAVLVGLDANGQIDFIRVAVGSCSATAKRLHGLEKDLLGVSPNDCSVDPVHLTPLAPISDIRGDAVYRLDSAPIQIKRAIMRAAQHG